MKSKTILFAASLALAAGTAFAADHAPLRPNEPGFNNLDKNNDGSISKSEARADKELSKNFSAADTDHDGKISRAEYLKHKGKEDVSTAADKTKQTVNKATAAIKSKTDTSSTGSSTK
ncbi:MAG TPA: EF-hand domain-containing protein [Burkholderiales bacterium]|nr:EF-hand domain-containing protein [Burkholderiales bacterium]